MITSLTFLIASTMVTIAPDAGDYFTIRVVDEQTGRGVPLVELRTVNNIRFHTRTQPASLPFMNQG